MDLTFDLKNTLVLIVAGLNLAYGFLIYLRGRKSTTNITFLFLTLSVGLWGLSMFAFRSAGSVADAIFFSKLLYFSAGLIPFVFVYFIFTFPEEKIRLNFFEKYIFPIPFFLIGTAALFPDFLIKDVVFSLGREHEIIFNKFIHTLYALYVILCFSYAYILLFKKYLSSKDKVLRSQIIYITIGTLLSTLVGVATNLLGPYLGFFQLNWFGQVGVIVMISLISYSILKYQLFNIKLILVEISLILFNLFLFVNIFTSHAQVDLVINSAIFSAILVFSALVLRGIYKDIRNRERIEGLVQEMEIANERLRVMEGQKTEFVSIASHQLRTPLTVIKGYASMILEGTFGHLSAEVRDAMEKLYKSSDRIVALVEDLLTVSRLEQGRMPLVFEPVDLAVFVQTILSEEDAMIKESGLAVSFNVGDDREFWSPLDEKKFKQVVKHILNNAVKYTVAPGMIHVTLSEDLVAQKNRIAISDTGVGMTAEQVRAVFERFNLKGEQVAVDAALRASETGGGGEEKAPTAKEAEEKEEGEMLEKKTPGIGLYIAQEIIQAHKGALRIESAGIGRGTTFIIELPRAPEPEEE